MLNKLIPLLSTLFLVYSCKTNNHTTQDNQQKKTKILEAEWLIGEWMFEDEEGRLHEDWFKKNDTTMIGYSYYIEGNNDTIFFEEIQINTSGDSVFFQSLTDVKKFTTPKMYSSLLTEENKFTFVNKKQAFPRQIKYASLNDTLMMIEITGIVDDMEETQPYQMIKQNRENND